MKILESWLREIINLNNISTEEIANLLTMSGSEVDEIEYVSYQFQNYSNLIIIEIVDYYIHNDLEDMFVCTVHCGNKNYKQVLCSKQSFAKLGDFKNKKFIYAIDDTIMPNGIKIVPKKLNEINYNGHICSYVDLGLSSSQDAIIISKDINLGTKLSNIDNLFIDSVFNLKITPNRADCLSIIGIARELSALTNTKIDLFKNKSKFLEKNLLSNKKIFPVNINIDNVCGRFTGRIIRNINNNIHTPLWMKKRLEYSGIKSISALVDISNYVMLEYGYPSHIYDFDKINGKEFTIRLAKQNEKVHLLNDQIITLDQNVNVISSNDKIECIAGIMGSMQSAVKTNTKNIYIELAFWYPKAIIGKAKKYKINSESSYRFERGVDYQDSIYIMEVISNLILNICGGTTESIDDYCYSIPQRNPILFRTTRCNKILGINIPTSTIAEIFNHLGFNFTIQENNIFTVIPPSYRFDINIEEDLIEEVARINGFDNIPEISVKAPNILKPDFEYKFTLHDLRKIMSGRNYHEIINYSFVDLKDELQFSESSDHINILNPIANNLSVMRTSLISGLINKIKYNFNRQQSSIKLFEIGRVFIKNNNIKGDNFNINGIEQPIFLSGAGFGPIFKNQWGLENRNIDFYDIKSDIETLFNSKKRNLRFKACSNKILHPGRGAKIYINSNEVGFIGELNPTLTKLMDLPLSPIIFELNTNYLIEKDIINVENISHFPIIIRDLSIKVDKKISYQRILDDINHLINTHEKISSILNDFNVFDVWENKSSNLKNIGLRFYFQSKYRTLEDIIINDCMNVISHELSIIYN